MLILLNVLPDFFNIQSNGAISKIKKCYILSSLLFLIVFSFETNGYRLKGMYSLLVINIIFLISTFTYFATVKNSTRKIANVIFIIPVIVISFASCLFGTLIRQYKINEYAKINVRNGGILGCGETVSITKSKFIFFDYEVINENMCLKGISKIIIKKLDENKAEFLIFHDTAMDSENPYLYIVERKNGW